MQTQNFLNTFNILTFNVSRSPTKLVLTYIKYTEQKIKTNVCVKFICMPNKKKKEKKTTPNAVLYYFMSSFSIYVVVVFHIPWIYNNMIHSHNILGSISLAGTDVCRTKPESNIDCSAIVHYFSLFSLSAETIILPELSSGRQDKSLYPEPLIPCQKNCSINNINYFSRIWH